MLHKRSLLLLVLIALLAISLPTEVLAAWDKILSRKEKGKGPANVVTDQWEGRIIDRKTEEPISGAIIVRSWNANFQALEDLENVFLDLEEAVSDEDGKFVFPERSSIVRLPFHSIEENKPLIYKPGYRVATPENRPPVIELERVPTTPEARKRELQRVTESKMAHFFEAENLQEITSRESEFIDDAFLNKRSFTSGSHPFIPINLFAHTPEEERRMDRFVFTSEQFKSPKGPNERSVTYATPWQAVDLLSRLNGKDSGVRNEAVRALRSTVTQRAVEPLLRALQDDDPQLRSNAASALTNYREPIILDSLLRAALSDDSTRVRAAAAGALAELKDRRTTDRLISAFKDGDYRVRRTAAWILWQMPDPRAAESLVGALHDEDPIFTRYASSALARMGFPAAGHLLNACRNFEQTERRVTSVVLARINEPAMIELLMDASQGKDIAIRSVAVEALGHMKATEAFDLLIQGLRDESPEVRGKASWALGNIGDKRAVGPLLRALTDRDLEVRSSAAGALGKMKEPAALEPLLRVMNSGISYRGSEAWALGKLGDTRAVEPLIRALGAREQRLRMWSAWALGEMKDPRAVAPLISALGDEDLEVRAYAIDSLAKIGDPRATEPLIAAMEHKHYRVRHSASKALGVLGDPRAIPPLLSAVRKRGLGEIEKVALSKMGHPAVEPLIELFRDIKKKKDEEALNNTPRKPPPTRLLSPQILRQRLKDGKAGETTKADSGVTETPTHPESPLHYNYPLNAENIIWVLEKIQDPSAIPMLITALTDDVQYVNRAAARALATFGQPAVEPIIRTLAEKDPKIKMSALEALAEIPGPRSEQALIRATTDEDASVRWFSLNALGKINPQKATELLIDALKVKRDRKNATQALSKIGAEAVDPLCRALLNEDSEIVSSAAWALGWIKDIRALEPLIAALNQERLKARKISRLRKPFSELKKAVELINQYLNIQQGLMLRDEASGRWTELSQMKAIVEFLKESEFERPEKDRSLEYLKGKSWVERQELLKARLAELTAHDFKDLNDNALALEKTRKSQKKDVLVSALKKSAAIEMKIEAAESLYDELKNEYLKVQRELVNSLGRLKDSRAAEALITVWDAGSPEIRPKAELALVEMGDAALDTLIEALKDKNQNRRWRAAWALGKIRESAKQNTDSKPLEPLITSLNDSDPAVRLCAAWALGEHYEERIKEPIAALLSDEDAGVTTFAAETLEKIRWHENLFGVKQE